MRYSLFLLCNFLIMPAVAQASEICKQHFEPYSTYWHKLGFQFDRCSQNQWIILRETGNERSCVLLNPTLNFSFWTRLESNEGFEFNEMRVLVFHRLVPNKREAHQLQIPPEGIDPATHKDIHIRVWIDKDELTVLPPEQSILPEPNKNSAFSMFIGNLPERTYKELASGNVLAIKMYSKDTTDLWVFSLKGSREALEKFSAYCLGLVE